MATGPKNLSKLERVLMREVWKIEVKKILTASIFNNQIHTNLIPHQKYCNLSVGPIH